MQKSVLQRQKSSAFFAVVIIMSLVSGMFAVSVAKSTQAAVASSSSSKTSLQAQQYAASKVDALKAMRYGSLANQDKRLIANSSTFYDEVIIGAESTFLDNPKIMQKECTVRVYKADEALPRCTLRFFRYSVEISSVPKGSVIPWYGSLDDIPDGFALCNSQNGTPNLTDRFIVGAGNTYTLGSIGGEAAHTLTVDEMPSHSHAQATNNGIEQDYGREVGYNLHQYFGNIPAQGYDYQDMAGPIPTSITGGNQPHENRPPYCALYFIMKL